jgi:hypothetical protein
VTITIASQPVLVDHDGSLQAWVDTFLKTCDQDQFWTPEPWLRSSGDFKDDDSLFESNLPQLPPIKLGCVQWPAVGCYRFARGLFAVDRVALRGITEAAWGVAWNTDGTFPIGWTQSATNAVSVLIQRGVIPEDNFAIRMHPLPPIQVSNDCWIIRLVDARYYLRASIGRLQPAPTWQSLFASSASRYNVLNISNPASVGYNPPPIEALTPDGAFFRCRTVPEALMIDAAVFTLGWRPVVPCRQTSGAVVDVVAQGPTAASITRASLLSLPSITGGWSTVRTLPRSFIMTFHQAWSFYGQMYKRIVKSDPTATNRHGAGLNTQCTLLNHVQVDSNGFHTLEPNSLALSAFADYIYLLHLQSNGWNQHEHSIAIPGLIEIVPSGHDDYIEWDCSTSGPVTRVKSLPNTFMPRCLFPQHAVPSAPQSEYAWWYSTHDQTMAAIALNDSEPGVWDQDNEAWQKQFTSVQLVDSGLLLPNATPTTKLAFAGVKALVARKSAIKAGESLLVHFVNQIVFKLVDGVTPNAPKVPVFEIFRGWVIGESSTQNREVIFSCELVTTEADTNSPYAGVKYASGTVIWATEPDLIGEVIDAYDHWCILDLSPSAHEGQRMIASWGVADSTASGVPPGTKTPFHWGLTDRCC